MSDLFILTSSPSSGTGGSASNIPGSVQNNINVPASSNTIVDSLTMTSDLASKWIIHARDAGSTVVQSSEVLAHHKNQLTTAFNHYSIIGDVIDLTVDVVIVGTVMQLKISNSEAFDLTVDVVRIQTTN